MLDNVNIINLQSLLMIVWEKRKVLFIINIMITIFTIFYVMQFDDIYEVTCKLKPAEQNDEINIYDNIQTLRGFSLTGDTKSDISDEITSTLLSDGFLQKIYLKHPNDTLIFKDILKKIDKEKSNKLIKSEKRQYLALKRLREIVSFVYDNNDNIVVSIKLENKYYAYFLIKEIITELKIHIKNKNLAILNSDIASYKDLITANDNPLVDEELKKILAKKINKSIMLSSNVFSIEDKSLIPYKKVWPKRSLFILVTSILGCIISVSGVLIYNKIRTVVK